MCCLCWPSVLYSSSESMLSGQGESRVRLSSGPGSDCWILNTKSVHVPHKSSNLKLMCVCVCVCICVYAWGWFLRTGSTARPALRATEPCWTWPSTAAAPRPKTRLVWARVCTCLCARWCRQIEARLRVRVNPCGNWTSSKHPRSSPVLLRLVFVLSSGSLVF